MDAMPRAGGDTPGLDLEALPDPVGIEAHLDLFGGHKRNFIFL